MKKIAIIGDLHIGKKLYGYDLRWHIRKSMYKFLELCVKEKCDSAVCLGDVFDSPSPRKADRKNIIQWLNEFEELKINMHVLAGNHDVTCDKGVPSALDELRIRNKYEYIHIHHRPANVDGVLMLPFPSPGIYSSFEEYLDDVKEVQYGTKIACAHFATVGCAIGEQDLPYRGKDYMCPDIPGCKRYYLGHIHKSQEPSLAHDVVGSSELLSFADAKNNLNFVIVDLEADTFTTHYHLSDINLVNIVINKEITETINNTNDFVNYCKEIIRQELFVFNILDNKLRRTLLVKVDQFIMDHVTIDWGVVEDSLQETCSKVFFGNMKDMRSKKVNNINNLSEIKNDYEIISDYLQKTVKDPCELRKLLNIFNNIQDYVEDACL